MSDARTAVIAIAAFAVLDLALVHEVAWPIPWPLPVTLLSVEALALVVALAWAAARGAAPSPRTVARIAALWVLLTLGRFVDVAVPAVFGRPLNLWWDGRHLPRVALLALADQPPWRAAAVLVIGGTGVAALALLLHRLAAAAVRALAGALRTRSVRRGAIALATPALLAGAAGLAAAYEPIGRHFATPVTASWGQQAAFAVQAMSPGSADRALPPSPAFDRDLHALDRADVIVVFAESYGATAFDDPAFAARLAGARAALAAATRDAGLQAVSTAVASPTFGGASWLAHSALLAGIDTRDPTRHDRLLASMRPNLVGHFRRHGWETVALMPGLRTDWPEGRYWGFDRQLDARTIGYDGPEFGFWRIPDQWSLARLHATELAATDRAPRLVVFPTITSHAPFRPVPPLAGDWTALATEPRRAWTTEEVGAALALAPDWADMRPAYGDALDYLLRSVAGWLRLPAGRARVIVLLGDHQPAATVSGRGARWDVPVHVLSDRPAVLARLRAAGFVDGLDPPRDPIGPMHTLTPLLLDAFAGCAPPSSATSPSPSAAHDGAGRQGCP
jgi:hypothetical protein